MNTTSKWYEMYKAAVLETDWTKMEERVRAAESAIAEQQNEFFLNHGGTPEERRAITDALTSLHILHKEAIGWLKRQNLGGTANQEKSSSPAP